ncbi:MAG: formylglycine-generating enzyme family protein [Nitrospinae bacterium]|nr:formylglycine-generating enzyme family protein [Nitrospinota bacterium]
MTFTGDKRMRFNAVLIAFLFLLAVAVPCAHAQKPKKKAAEAKPTVVLLPVILHVTKIEGDFTASIKIIDVVANEVVMSKSDICRKCAIVDVVEKLRSLASGEKAEKSPEPVVKAPAEKEQPGKAAGGNEMELNFWNSVKDSDNPEDFKAYLESYPKGSFAPLAKSRIAALKKSAGQTSKLPPPPRETAGGDSSNKEVAVWNSVKESTNPEDIEVYLQAYPKGVFASIANKRLIAMKKAAEEAKHRGMVYVKKGGGGFWMDKYLVTQESYDKVIGINPSHFKNCPKCPVEQVSWTEADTYCKKVGSVLPKEKDWKYAASEGGKNTWAGTSSESELGEYAWYLVNSGNKTHPVGQKRPNGLGLYDMSGNVWEWMADWYDNEQKYRVLGGGSWFSDAVGLRVAVRNYGTPVTHGSGLGFRCVQYYIYPLSLYPLTL